MRSRPPFRLSCGFTLIELMVAIGILALTAVLSWRGLDSMTRAKNQLEQRADEVLALQAGLNQWGTDLDALLQLPQTPALDWDGRALRLVRRSAPGANSAGAETAGGKALAALEVAAQVVAWSRRNIDGTGQWLRWQSPPLRTRGELQAAWALAAQWAQNPGDEVKKREVRLGALSQMQIFYFRGDAWTNPLSSEGAATTPVGTLFGNTTKADPSVPDGVRLVLTLPEGRAINGVITRDWVRPTLGGGKS